MQNCAQITAPTGGDADVKAPKLDSNGTMPLNYSTNFSQDKIVLTFNEYFVLKNPKSNVFFSPSIENDPEFITKGKTLTILLNNELKENTTYTINFGDAISDYTVGNKIPDFKYVFSTGQFIDSMETSGNIIDAFTGSPAEDVLVMLYDNFEDSIVSNSKPIYYAKSDEKGKFVINYVKAGKYKMVALKDENRNFKYDLPNEKIGFIDSTLNLIDTNLQSRIILRVFEKEHKKQSVIFKKYEFPGKLTLVFEKPAKEIKILKSDGTELSGDRVLFSKERDSVTYWKPNLDSVKNILTVQLDTTTENIKVYAFKKPKKEKGLRVISYSKTIDIENPFQVTFDRPIDHTDNPSIQIFKDSISVVIDSIAINSSTLSLYFKKGEDLSYRFHFLDEAITDIFNAKNLDTISGYINVRKKDYYGSFTLKLNSHSDSINYVISLLDEQDVLIQKKTAQGNTSITFNKLTPGKYKIKAIEDLNNNSKWDTGNYYKRLSPESVYFYPAPIEIRSNWEMAESWEL